MHRIWITLLVVLAGIDLGAQSHFSYSTSLTGSSERPVPPTPSLAAGVADLTVDVFPNFTTIAWTVRWSGLSGLPTAAHLHGPAGLEEAAPVLFSLGSYFSSSTPAAGTYAGFRQISDPAQIAAIRDGRAYLNLHTERFPDGEIRGQLLFIPEPSTLALVGTGLLLFGLGYLRRNPGRAAAGGNCPCPGRREPPGHALFPKSPDQKD